MTVRTMLLSWRPLLVSRSKWTTSRSLAGAQEGLSYSPVSVIRRRSPVPSVLIENSWGWPSTVRRKATLVPSGEGGRAAASDDRTVRLWKTDCRLPR
ncbi:hypothetical protein [Streptomyces sp. NPDC001530]|uniref:hypothetical protein n=1 Tax=Streptomyces sp. NPDC001530 TaxID=3364582 RepID=UPI00367B6CB1